MPMHKFFEENNTLGTRYLVHSKIGTHLVAGQARKQHKHTHTTMVNVYFRGYR